MKLARQKHYNKEVLLKKSTATPPCRKGVSGIIVVSSLGNVPQTQETVFRSEVLK